MMILKILSISMCFSLFDRGQNLHKLSGDEIKCLIMGGGGGRSESQLSASVDFPRVVQS